MKKQESDPSSFVQVDDSDPQGPRHLTASQAKALTELSALAQLTGYDSTYADIKPRAKPLIIGPSGSGKTALLRRLGDLLGTPGKPYSMLSVNCGTWIVFGAKAEPATLETIRRFVRTNDRGCIFLDEVDKLVCGKEAWSTGWDRATLTEGLALLDNCPRLLTSGWHPDDVAKLNRFLIVGAGTWQTMTSGKEEWSHADQVKAKSVLPEELTFRFNERWIPLSLPTPKDFRKILTRLYRDLDLALPNSDNLEKLVSAAVESRTGMRWIEQHLSDLLCLHPQRRRPSQLAAAQKPEKPNKFTHVPPVEYLRLLDQAYTMMEVLEPSLAHIQFLFRLHQERFAKVYGDVTDGTTGEPISPVKLYSEFTDLLDGFRHRYSLSQAERDEREKRIWIQGHDVLLAIWTASNLETAFLHEQQLLPLFSEVYARLSRLLVAWRHFTTLRPETT